MKAIQVKEYGGYEKLELVDIEKPVLAEGQLLIRVTHAAVNPVDNAMRQGFMPTPLKPPMVLGNEGAGYVVIGNEQFPQGTRVIISCVTPEGTSRGLMTNGTWQEFLALYPSELLPTPVHTSNEEAAAFAVGFFSAQACLNRAEFKKGKSVLSLAAGGSVGNAGVQLAKAGGASIVITTVGSTEKANRAADHGIENVIDLSVESLREGVLRLTEGRGVDVVVDSLGGKYTGEAISVLARQGIIASIGASAGTKIQASMMDFILKNAQLRGVSVNTYFTVAHQQEIWSQTWPLLMEGTVKPIVAGVFHLDEIAEAQKFHAESRPFGKILIKF